jgi:hypothetical protein
MKSKTAPCVETRNKTSKQKRARVKLESWIVDQILTSDEFVNWAIVALYKRQMESERDKRRTVVKNGVGFSAYHARSLSEIAERVLETGEMTDADGAYCREVMKNGFPRLGWYRRQLANIYRAELESTEAA